MKLIYEREGERIAYPVAEGEMFIGRKDYCDLCFPDASVSKRHVRIVRDGSRIELYDAGSRNGTLVNGQTVDRCDLSHGDVIQVGKITLKVSRDGGGDDGVRVERPNPKRDDSFRDFDDFDDGKSGAPRGASGARRSRDEEESEEPRARPTTGASRSVEEPAAAASPKASGVAELQPEESGSVKLVCATFVITAGEGKGQTFELTEEKPVTIGTKEENTIAIHGEGISRYHAEVVCENGAWVLKDLGSRNGTFVAGRKVDLHELAPGDEVQIGTVTLRFEQREAAPVVSGGLKELIELAKKDPVAFLKSPAGMRSTVAVVAAILLAIILWPQGDGGPGGGEGGAGVSLGAYAHAAIEVLKKNQREAARGVHDALKNSPKAVQEKTLVRDLEELGRVWDQHSSPLVFDWKNAGTVIEKVQRDGAQDLDKDCLVWLAQMAKEVESEEPNYRLTVRGAADRHQAAQALASGDVKTGAEALKRSYDTYGQVPRASVLYESAQAQRQLARLQLFKTLQSAAERLAQTDPPPWPDAIALLNEALQFAETGDEKAPVRRRIDDYDANLKDEEAFATAVDIVQQRNLPKYPEAIAALGKVSKTSRVYLDAQTYLHWIEADMDVRNAKVAYDAGEWDKAKNLLLKALRVAELGPDAKASVTRRLDSWGKVLEAYNQAEDLYAKQDWKASKSAFAGVIKLEPNTKNHYFKRSQARIIDIEKADDEVIATKRKNAFDYLEHGRYRDAFDTFKEVALARKDPAGRQKFEAAVAKANRERRLYIEARNRWQTDEEATPEAIIDTLRLLRHFLPANDPDKKGAIELYEKVKKRLDELFRRHDMEKDDEDEKQK
jgi:pSer/pThr/pTyr-binding forkhead associated (FHA) protein